MFNRFESVHPGTRVSIGLAEVGNTSVGAHLSSDRQSVGSVALVSLLQDRTEPDADSGIVI